MKDKGRLIIWRKFQDDWKWKNPLHRAAWLWMLMKAAYAPHNGLQRGQLYFSISQGPKEWGMSTDQTRRFLNKCEKGHRGQSPDIVWQRGRTGIKGRVIATSSATSSATSGATSRGIITLLNYDKYNPPQKGSATSGATSGASSTATIEKESIKKESKEVPQPSADASPSVPQETGSKKAKTPKKPTDPRVKQLIDYFSNRHLEMFGHKYTVSGAKDGQTFKDLLKDHTSEIITACIDLLFADTDEWLNGRRTIPVFRSKINAYLQQLNQAPEAPVPAAYRKLA